MEVYAAVQVGCARVVQCFIYVGEDLEQCSLVYWEPVELPKVWCDVCAVWEVEDESGCCVLDGLQSSREMFGDSSVERVSSLLVMRA